METILSSTTFIPTALLTASVAALITSESLAFYPGSASFKLVASTAFVYCASTSPLLAAPEDAVNPIDKKYATIIAGSLLCGLIGDALLVPSRERYDATTLPPPLKVLQKWAAKKAEALKLIEDKKQGKEAQNKEPDEADTILFKLGMLAFMLNHVGYIMAFTSRGIPIDRAFFAVMLILCAAVGPLAGIPFPAFISNLFRSKKTAEVVQPTSIAEAGEKGAKTQRPQLKRNDSGITDVDITPANTPIVDAFSSGLSSASSASLNSLNNRMTPPPSSAPMSKSLSTSSNTSSTSTPPSIAAPKQEKKSFIPELDIPADMEPLIFIYHIIISTMVASSLSSIPSADITSSAVMAERQRCIMAAVGAITFMVSDMFVAWDVFAKPIDMDKWRESKVWKSRKERRGWRSRGVGWVLYFGAQMMMARSLH